MARLAYYAPGVYVEEIPSARQPIAGVGTNTVGFIGIVPDTVYIPVPNPDYDPVLSNDLLEFARLNALAPRTDPAAEQKRQSDLAAMQQDLKDRMALIDQEIKALADNKPALDKAIADADAALKLATTAESGLAATATAAETAAKVNDVRTAQQALATAKTEAANAATLAAQKDADRKNLETKLTDAAKPPAAAAPAGAAEVELTDYAGKEPDAALLQKSLLRPYYLVPFEVKADEFATKLCTNFSEYTRLFGDFSAFGKSGEDFVPLHLGHHLLTHALNGFFTNGGTRAFVARIKSGDGLAKTLDKVLERFTSIEDVALLAAPGLPKSADVWGQLESYCEKDVHQNVFGILDSPAVVNDGVSDDFDILKLQYETLGNLLPRKSTHAGYYFPHIEVSDPAKQLQDSDPARRISAKYRGRTHIAPSGHVAGIIARTDEERGVHKAPANATVRGALEVKYYVSKPKQEMLNPQGVNCIRLMNGDVTLWGARTIGGDRNGEWKYVSVRRFAGFLEASIDRGTQWVVFEPNDPRLWSKIILNITAFLTDVWRGGALFGLTPQEAFYVKCDAELNPIEVRDMGWVVTEIGVSIVRPAEFVIFRISQSVGAQQG